MTSGSEWSQALIYGITLRVLFYLGCRRYVKRILTSDITRAIQEQASTTHADDSSSDTPLATPTKSRTAFTWSQQGTGSLLPTTSSNASSAKLQTTQRPSSQQSFLPKLASFVFCASFADSCMLFTLVIFGNVLGERYARFWLAQRAC